MSIAGLFSETNLWNCQLVSYPDPVLPPYESYLTAWVDPPHQESGTKRGRETHAGQRVLLAEGLCKLFSISMLMWTARDTVVKPDLIEWNMYKQLALEVGC